MTVLQGFGERNFAVFVPADDFVKIVGQNKPRLSEFYSFGFGDGYAFRLTASYHIAFVFRNERQNLQGDTQGCIYVVNQHYVGA